MGKKLPKRKAKHLTDASLKKIVPMFVESKSSSSDHKCGTCLFRVGKDQCAIMRGKISFARGSCSFWAKGPAMPAVNPVRLTKEGAGYVEVDPGQKINCGTCTYYQGGLCQIWNASVHKGDCCMVWKQNG